MICSSSRADLCQVVKPLHRKLRCEPRNALRKDDKLAKRAMQLEENIDEKARH